MVSENFGGEERIKKIKHHRQQTSPHSPPRVVLKGKRHRDSSNATT